MSISEFTEDIASFLGTAIQLGTILVAQRQILLASEAGKVLILGGLTSGPILLSSFRGDSSLSLLRSRGPGLLRLLPSSRSAVPVRRVGRRRISMLWRGRVLYSVSMHPFHVITQIPLAREAIVRLGAVTVWVLASKWPITMSVKGVSFTFVPQEAGSRRKSLGLARRTITCVGFQMRVQMFAIRRRLDHILQAWNGMTSLIITFQLLRLMIAFSGSFKRAVVESILPRWRLVKRVLPSVGSRISGTGAPGDTIWTGQRTVRLGTIQLGLLVQINPWNWKS